MALEKQVDHRVVARAYRELEEEGWVEVRGRSGVRVAQPASRRVDSQLQRDLLFRVVDTMAEGWRHDVSLPALASLFQRCADASAFRCACVESNLDQMTAYCAEVGTATGMTMVPAYLGPQDRERIEDAEAARRLAEILGQVDMVVTTQYHSTAVRAAMEGASASLIVLRINPDLADTIRARIRAQGLTLLAATPEFGERVRLMYDDVIEREDQLRVVLVGEDGPMERMDPLEPVLLTRAARERVPALGALRMVFPHSPTLADESIREVSTEIVRLNLIRHPPALASAG